MPGSETLIVVTGATGFVGSHIVARLLASGARVRGTTRDPGGSSSECLRALPGAGERLELVAADVLDAGAVEAAVTGAEGVIHTASPYRLHVRDPRRELVEPAVNGTRHVLEACAAHRSIRRVVVTSSMAAITDRPTRRRVLTEEDWNTRSTLRRNPYYLSKTLAERAAWEFVAAEHPPFDVVAVNPFLTIGPSLTPRLNASNRVLADVLNGRYPGILALSWGFVDVRDVAEAHVRALAYPDANGRYICAGDVVSMRTVVEWLAAAGYRRSARLPTLGLDNAAGRILVRLASFTYPRGVGSYLRTHIGRTPRYDTSRIQRHLGMSFRPARDTVLDTAADLERWDHVATRRWRRTAP